MQSGNQILNSQNTPHTSSSWVMYGVSIAGSNRNLTFFITRPHCTLVCSLGPILKTMSYHSMDDNYIHHNVGNKISYPFTNTNGAAFEVGNG